MKEICRKIYELIKSEATSAGTLSVRDICQRLDIKSTSTVHRYLNELEESGLISRTNDKHRYITLPAQPTCQVPLLGTITAGQPIAAIEEIEGYIPLTDFRGDVNDLFALNVRGDSMIEAGILDGDIVILRQTPYARNGQIVAAMMDGEATLKRFYKENGHFRLQPENSSMEPFIVDEVIILGTLVALYRRYE